MLLLGATNAQGFVLGRLSRIHFVLCNACLNVVADGNVLVTAEQGDCGSPNRKIERTRVEMASKISKKRVPR